MEKSSFWIFMMGKDKRYILLPFVKNRKQPKLHCNSDSLEIASVFWQTICPNFLQWSSQPHP